jgi:hypothetical protein
LIREDNGFIWMQFEASRNFLQKSAPNEKKKIIRKIRQSAAAQHFPEKTDDRQDQ